MVAADSHSAVPSRSLGRFELLRLLGKSARTMCWLVLDPQSGHELMLVLPRAQPGSVSELERWMQSARKAARIRHPSLAAVVEIGQEQHWPYLAYERANFATLAERASAKGEAPTDSVAWLIQALTGLAFAHEAGVPHGDPQLHMLLADDSGQVRLMGLAAARQGGDSADAPGPSAGPRTLSIDIDALQAQRSSAERDVLGMGIILHQLLAAHPALDEPDVGLVIDQLPPHGRDLVRLPWSIPRPVSDPLRVIVNRATDRQERQRYRSARTLIAALSAWLDAETQQDGGTFAALLEQARHRGALPALPGGAERAARMASMMREHTAELAEIVLRDPALAFELLRLVNTAQVRGTQVSGNGPVLTMRRAIAMIGLDGVRQAAAGLRHWPGPLEDGPARELAALIDRGKQAGRVAQALRLPGYDGEVVYLLALLQNLGRLLVQYHFPDELAQIRRLMQSVAATADEPEQPGMSEENAAFAVLGVDIESLGVAMARHWGMDDTLLHMMRRLSMRASVRAPDNDNDLLRATASAANEAMDALALPAAEISAAVEKVAHRYARVLNLTARDVQAALQVSRDGQRGPSDGDTTLSVVDGEAKLGGWPD